MKKDICAFISLVFMVICITAFLLRYDTVSEVAMVIFLAAWWKSGYRITID